MEFTFNIIAEGTVFLLPKFVRCPMCGHEIPVGEIIDDHIGYCIPHTIVDNGGCGLSFPLVEVMKYFGIIKNVRI